LGGRTDYVMPLSLFSLLRLYGFVLPLVGSRTGPLFCTPPVAMRGKIFSLRTVTAGKVEGGVVRGENVVPFCTFCRAAA